MPLPTIQQITKDAEFQQLPPEEQNKVFAKIDPDFAALPQVEQNKAANALMGRTPQAYPGGQELDHPVSHEEARRIAGEDIVKKARAAGQNDIVTGAEIGQPQAMFATPTGILPQIVSNTRSALKSIPGVGLISEGGFKGVEEGAKALAPDVVNKNIESVGREAMDRNFPVSNAAGELAGQLPTAFVSAPEVAGLKGWQLIKGGAKAGALFGGQGALQSNLQEQGLPTNLDKAEKLGTDVVTGTALGTVIGGGIPVGGMVLGKIGGVLGKVPSMLQSRAANVARKEAQEGAVEKLTQEAVDSVTKPKTIAGAPEKAPQTANLQGNEAVIDETKPTALNTEATPETPKSEVPDEKYMPSDAREQAKKVAQVKASVKQAVDNGIPNEHTSDLIKMNDQERAIALDFVKAGEMRAVGDPHAPSPEEIQAMGGEEVRKPIIAVGELKKRAGQELGALFDTIPDVPVHDLPAGKRPIDHIMTELNKVGELKGLSITEDGALDFSRTTLKGPENAGARKTIEAYLNQIKSETPYQLHLTRQELFEVLGGKKLAQVQLNATEEKALEGVRKGLATFLDQNVQGYKAANQKYAKIVEPLKMLNKIFKYGNLEDRMAENQDILDEGAGVLLRRLTSNIKSKVEIKKALQQINAILKENGIENNVRPEKIQEAYNIVSSHFPEIDPKTAFKNQVKEGVRAAQGDGPTGRTLTELALSGAKKVGQELLPVQQSDATRQKALQDLIQSLGVDSNERGPLVLPKFEAPKAAPRPLKPAEAGKLGDQFY
jgi:hypothetical protein